MRGDRRHWESDKKNQKNLPGACPLPGCFATDEMPVVGIGSTADRFTSDRYPGDLLDRRPPIPWSSAAATHSNSGR